MLVLEDLSMTHSQQVTSTARLHEGPGPVQSSTTAPVGRRTSYTYRDLPTKLQQACKLHSFGHSEYRGIWWHWRSSSGDQHLWHGTCVWSQFNSVETDWLILSLSTALSTRGDVGSVYLPLPTGSASIFPRYQWWAASCHAVLSSHWCLTEFQKYGGSAQLGRGLHQIQYFTHFVFCTLRKFRPPSLKAVGSILYSN